MIRLFDEHKIRHIQLLDGAWKFAVDPEGIGESDGWQNGIPSCETVTVPSVWNTMWGLLEYEGAAFYEREFYTKGGTLRFVFGAVMTEATVWIDGELLGSHYGGFCQFELIKRGVTEGTHMLLSQSAGARRTENASGGPFFMVFQYYYICNDKC